MLKSISETNSFRAMANKKAEGIPELVETKNSLLEQIKEAETARFQEMKK